MGKKIGLTLIELSIVLLLTAFIMGIMVIAYIAGTKIFNEEIEKSSALMEANKTISSLRSDLRSCLQLVSASSTNISFWAEDLNSNGTREANETISYSWDGISGNPLIKTISGSSYMVAKNIRNFSLTYNSANLSAITQVNIKVTAGTSTNLATVETSVKLRNI